MRRSSRPLHAIASFCLAACLATASACTNGQTPSGATCPPDSTLTYATFGEPFFRTYCNGCHNGRADPLLTSQRDIQANADLVDGVAAAGPNAVNTSMPERMSVPLAERQKLGEWLACGAP